MALLTTLQKLTKGLLRLTALFFGCTGFSQQLDVPHWKTKINNYSKLSAEFKNPPSFYAPHMFWFWDTKLDSVQISQQARDMVSKHINPGYVHARGEYFWDYTLPTMPKKDLLTEYWFNCFKGGLKQTEAKGYHMSFDSEYLWPSGQAGGKVLQKHPEVKAQTLFHTRQVILGPWTAHISQGSFSTLARLGEKGIIASTLQVVAEKGEKTIEVPEGTWVLYTYRPDFHSGYDGGEVNYLDPLTANYFMDIAEKPYLEKFQKQAGKTMAGVYPDHEGDFGWAMAWSEHFAKRFLEMKGKDIRTILPLLTERDEEGLWVKARCDWFEVVSDIYSKDYWGAMSNYNEKNDMYTITNLWESPLMLVTQTVGDLMKLNRQVTMPGVDQLGYRNQDVLDYKETQTVVELEDKPFMCEVLCWIGWQQTPHDMKACTNAATAFGVTHHVPNCISTNRDMALTQYPAELYTENPYWEYLDQWADYTKRASFVTRMTKLNADVLLLSPLESVWAYSEPYFEKYTQPNYFHWDRDPDWNKDARRLDSVYTKCMRTLESNNLDFLIGDTYYMNKAKANNDRSFTINDHNFKIIVVPEMLVMAHSTAKKLLELAQKNIPIVIVSNLPTSSPDKGYGDLGLQDLMKQLLSNQNVIDLRKEHNPTDIIASKINSLISPKIAFQGNKVPLFFAHRTFGKKHFYWIANKSGKKISASFTLRYGNGQAQIWNGENGNITAIKYKKEKAGALIKYNFEPYEGFWIVFDDQLPAVKEIVNTKAKAVVRDSLTVPSVWTVSVDTTFKSQVTSAVAVRDLNADQKLDSANRISLLGKNLVPGIFWKIEIPLSAENVFITGLAHAVFYIDGRLAKLENNSIAIPENAKHLFISTDKADNKSFIDSPILFSCRRKSKTTLKKWSDYGLAQYTGFLYYENNFSLKELTKSIQMDLGNITFMAEVWINDSLVGSRLWSPFTFDVTKYVREGSNKVKIKIGNLYLNASSVDDDMNIFIYKKDRASHGTTRPKWGGFDAGLLGPVKINIY
ncbi:MAG TPA: glycosyl hydrolase [Cytophagaceae bacterium]